MAVFTVRNVTSIVCVLPIRALSVLVINVTRNRTFVVINVTSISLTSFLSSLFIPVINVTTIISFNVNNVTTIAWVEHTFPCVPLSLT